MFFLAVYAQELINEELSFPAMDYKEASRHMREFVFNNEPIHIPVIIMQKGGPTDEENSEFLAKVSSKFNFDGNPYIVFDFSRKIEIGSGLDMSNVADSNSIDIAKLKVKDLLIDVKTVLNVLQSYKAPMTKGPYAYDNVAFDKDIIELCQDDNSVNSLVSQIGKWLGLYIIDT